MCVFVSIQYLTLQVVTCISAYRRGLDLHLLLLETTKQHDILADFILPIHLCARTVIHSLHKSYPRNRTQHR
jgi:hypothetical protein